MGFEKLKDDNGDESRKKMSRLSSFKQTLLSKRVPSGGDPFMRYTDLEDSGIGGRDMDICSDSVEYDSHSDLKMKVLYGNGGDETSAKSNRSGGTHGTAASTIDSTVNSTMDSSTILNPINASQNNAGNDNSALDAYYEEDDDDDYSAMQTVATFSTEVSSTNQVNNRSVSYQMDTGRDCHNLDGRRTATSVGDESKDESHQTNQTQLTHQTNQTSKTQIVSNVSPNKSGSGRQPSVLKPTSFSNPQNAQAGMSRFHQSNRSKSSQSTKGLPSPALVAERVATRRKQKESTVTQQQQSRNSSSFSSPQQTKRKGESAMNASTANDANRSPTSVMDMSALSGPSFDYDNVELGYQSFLLKKDLGGDDDSEEEGRGGGDHEDDIFDEDQDDVDVIDEGDEKTEENEGDSEADDESGEAPQILFTMERATSSKDARNDENNTSNDSGSNGKTSNNLSKIKDTLVRVRSKKTDDKKNRKSDNSDISSDENEQENLNEQENPNDISTFEPSNAAAIDANNTSSVSQNTNIRSSSKAEASSSIEGKQIKVSPNQSKNANKKAGSGGSSSTSSNAKDVNSIAKGIKLRKTRFKLPKIRIASGVKNDEVSSMEKGKTNKPSSKQSSKQISTNTSTIKQFKQSSPVKPAAATKQSKQSKLANKTTEPVTKPVQKKKRSKFFRRILLSSMSNEDATRHAPLPPEDENEDENNEESDEPVKLEELEEDDFMDDAKVNLEDGRLIPVPSAEPVHDPAQEEDKLQSNNQVREEKASLNPEDNALPLTTLPSSKEITSNRFSKPHDNQVEIVDTEDEDTLREQAHEDDERHETDDASKPAPQAFDAMAAMKAAKAAKLAKANQAIHAANSRANLKYPTLHSSPSHASDASHCTKSNTSGDESESVSKALRTSKPPSLTPSPMSMRATSSKSMNAVNISYTSIETERSFKKGRSMDNSSMDAFESGRVTPSTSIAGTASIPSKSGRETPFSAAGQSVGHSISQSTGHSVGQSVGLSIRTESPSTTQSKLNEEDEMIKNVLDVSQDGNECPTWRVVTPDNNIMKKHNADYFFHSNTDREDTDMDDGKELLNFSSVEVEWVTNSTSSANDKGHLEGHVEVIPHSRLGANMDPISMKSHNEEDGPEEVGLEADEVSWPTLSDVNNTGGANNEANEAAVAAAVMEDILVVDTSAVVVTNNVEDEEDSVATRYNTKGVNDSATAQEILNELDPGLQPDNKQGKQGHVKPSSKSASKPLSKLPLSKNTSGGEKKPSILDAINAESKKSRNVAAGSTPATTYLDTLPAGTVPSQEEMQIVESQSSNSDVGFDAEAVKLEEELLDGTLGDTIEDQSVEYEYQPQGRDRDSVESNDIRERSTRSSKSHRSSRHGRHGGEIMSREDMLVENFVSTCDNGFTSFLEVVDHYFGGRDDETDSDSESTYYSEEEEEDDRRRHRHHEGRRRRKSHSGSVKKYRSHSNGRHRRTHNERSAHRRSKSAHKEHGKTRPSSRKRQVKVYKKERSDDRYNRRKNSPSPVRADSRSPSIEDRRGSRANKQGGHRHHSRSRSPSLSNESDSIERMSAEDATLESEIDTVEERKRKQRNSSSRGKRSTRSYGSGKKKVVSGSRRGKSSSRKR